MTELLTLRYLFEMPTPTVVEDTRPKFRDPSEMTAEELTDPGYRIKRLARQAGLSPSEMLICSKCHHCR